MKVSSKHLPVAPAQLDPGSAGVLSLSSPQTSSPATVDALTRRVLSSAHARAALARPELHPAPPAPTFLFAHAMPNADHLRTSSGRSRSGSRERVSRRAPVVMEGGSSPIGGKKRVSARPKDERPASLGQVSLEDDALGCCWREVR